MKTQKHTYIKENLLREKNHAIDFLLYFCPKPKKHFMKYLLLIPALAMAVLASAQTTHKKDIIGTWHFYRMTNNGKIMIDASDPKVLQNMMNEQMKKKQGMTDEDKKKMATQGEAMQKAYEQVTVTYNEDGTMEDATLQTIAEGKPKNKGTYVFDEQSGKLTATKVGSNDEVTIVKVADGVLTAEIPNMGMTILFKK